MTYRRRGIGYLGSAPAGSSITAPSSKGSESTFTARPVTTTYTPPPSALIPSFCRDLTRPSAEVARPYLAPAIIPVEHWVIVATTITNAQAAAIANGETGRSRLESIHRQLAREIERKLEDSYKHAREEMLRYSLESERAGNVGNVWYVAARARKPIGVGPRVWMQNALFGEIQRASRIRPILALPGRVTDPNDIERAAVAIAGGLENFRAAFAGAVINPATDIPIAIRSSGVENLTAGINAVNGAAAFASSAVAGSQAFVPQAEQTIGMARQAASSADSPEAATVVSQVIDRLVVEIDGMIERITNGYLSPLGRQVQLIQLGFETAAKRPSPSVAIRQIDILGMMRRKAESSIATLVRSFPDSQLSRQFVECQAWEKVAEQFPIQQANIATLATAAAQHEAMYASPAFVTTSQTAIATLNAAVTPIQEVFARLRQVQAELRNIQSQLGIPWYLKRFGPLPFWAWGAIGSATLIGGVVLLKKKKVSVATPSKAKS